MKKPLVTERKGTTIPTAAICLLQYRLWYSDGESVSNHQDKAAQSSRGFIASVLDLSI